MPEPSFVALTGALLDLPRAQQRQLALRLAEIALPFTMLDPQDDETTLVPLVEALRRGDGLVDIERARHNLFEGARLWETEEPSGLAWYAQRARDVWIYAADAASTSPRDGVLNAFLVLDDLLDQAHADIDDVDLGHQLRVLLADGSRSFDALQDAIALLVDRLGSQDARH